MNLDAVAGHYQYPRSSYNQPIRYKFAHGGHVSPPPMKQRQSHTGEACQSQRVKGGGASNGREVVDDDGRSGGEGLGFARGNGHDRHRSRMTTTVHDHDKAECRTIAVSPMPTKMPRAISGMTPELMEMQEGSGSHQFYCSTDYRNCAPLGLGCQDRVVYNSPFTPPPTAAAAATADSSSLSSTAKLIRRKCSIPDCPKNVVQGGLCIAHGAKRKTCSLEGCTKNVKQLGLESTHGPTRKRCKYYEGCTKVAVKSGLCIAHGASRRGCSHNECENQAVVGGMCVRHYYQESNRIAKGLTPSMTTASEDDVDDEDNDDISSDEHADPSDVSLQTTRTGEGHQRQRGLSLFNDGASMSTIINSVPPVDNNSLHGLSRLHHNDTGCPETSSSNLKVSGLAPELMEMEKDSGPRQLQDSAACQPSVSFECQERVVCNSSSSASAAAAAAATTPSSSLSSSVDIVAAVILGKKKGDSSLGAQKLKKRRHEESHLNTENTQLFEEGQHVFVIFGKIEYPAVIVSVEHQVAWVRWSATGFLQEVKVEQLRPMFEEINGHIYSSSYSVRNRQPTNRYAPLLQEMPSKRKQNKSDPKDGEQFRVRACAKKAPTTDTFDSSGSTRVTPGAAPSTRKHNKTDRFSPPDWPYTMKNSVLYASKSNSTPSSAINEGKQAGLDSDFITEKLETKAPSKNASSRQVTVPERMVGRKKSLLITMPVSEPLRSTRIRNPTNRYAPPESNTKSSGQFQVVQTPSSHVAPDSGREVSSLIKSGWHSSTHWISPSGKRFFCLRRAFRFERMKRQSNGDEEKAWVLFKQKRKGRKHSPKSQAQGETSRNRTSELLLKEGRKRQASGLSDDPSCKQNRHRRAKMASTEIQSQPSKLSDQDESEYKSLWSYYMTPVVRRDEELRSGIVLRTKRAKCSLLRSRGSAFRQALHGRLLSLEKKGDKSEILVMLREMKEFDMSMQSGDGPPQLVAKIIGPQKDGDVEVIGSLERSGIQSRNKMIKEVDALIDLSSSYERSAKADVSENSSVKVRQSTAVQQADRLIPLKNNLPLADMESNLLGAPTAPCLDEVIDLCQDAPVESSCCTQSDKNDSSYKIKVSVLKSTAGCTDQDQQAGRSTLVKSNSLTAVGTPSAQVEPALPKYELIDLCEDGSSQGGEVVDLLDDEDKEEVIVID